MTPSEQEAEWDAWERRNPGVAHPGRAAARNARGRDAFVRDWAQGTSRFDVPPPTLAEKARAARDPGRRRAREATAIPKPW
jgi:hypothetical protein